MSQLRPTLIDADPRMPCASNGTAYLMILNAVEERDGLIHGKLECRGEYCAIGSYFHLHANKMALPTPLIDEVAAVNDSVPSATPKARKAMVARWLKWKLQRLGFPLLGRPIKDNPLQALRKAG